MQLAEFSDEVCKVKGASECYLKVMNRCSKYRLKLAMLCTIVAKKPGSNYPDLEPGDQFWKQFQVPGCGYKTK